MGKEFDRIIKRRQRAFKTFVLVMMVIVTGTLATCGYVIKTVGSEVESKGLKGVGEEIWYGKDGA